jgi:hypothetical protein
MVGAYRRNSGRRAFLKTGGRALAGMAGILAAGRAPASWAARELSLLTAVNYAPASDVKLGELAKRFTKASGVNVRIDHIQSVQMPAKLSAEIMSKSGHDIMSLEMHYAWLFQPGLVDVTDMCNDLAKKHGDWHSFLKEHALVKGQCSAFRSCSPRSRAAIGSTCSRRSASGSPTRGRTCSGPGAS